MRSVRRLLGLVVVTVAVAAAPLCAVAVEESCAGDCDADGQVSVDDLVAAVRVALALAPIFRCAGA